MAMQISRNVKLGTKTMGPKYLVVSRMDSEEGLEKLNPFLLKKCIDELTGESPISAKKLRDGKILIHTSNLEQAEKLVTLIQFDEATKVKVSLHPHLNKSKGVVWNRDFQYIEDNELLEALKDQGVTGIQRMKKRNPSTGLEFETGLYFLFFDTQDIPNHIMCGYEKVAVREFEPDPQRCFKCLQFGHLQAACRAEAKICGNCGEESHTDWKKKERCDREKLCTNCQSTEHGSFFKKCPAFIKEKTILKIGKEESVDPGEARRIYRAKFQKETFPSPSDHLGQSSNKTDCRNCGKLAVVVRELQKRIKEIEARQKNGLESRNTKDTYECNLTSGSPPQGIETEDEANDDEEMEEYSSDSSGSSGLPGLPENSNKRADEVTEKIHTMLSRKVSPLPGNKTKKKKLDHKYTN